MAEKGREVDALARSSTAQIEAVLQRSADLVKMDFEALQKVAVPLKAIAANNGACGLGCSTLATGEEVSEADAERFEALAGSASAAQIDLIIGRASVFAKMDASAIQKIAVPLRGIAANNGVCGLGCGASELELAGRS
jgi:hypothetical protein